VAPSLFWCAGARGRGYRRDSRFPRELGTRYIFFFDQATALLARLAAVVHLPRWQAVSAASRATRENKNPRLTPTAGNQTALGIVKL